MHEIVILRQVFAMATGQHCILQPNFEKSNEK